MGVVEGCPGYGGGGTTGAMAMVENTLTSDHQNYVLPTPERGSSWVACLKFEALNAIQGAIVESH
jgi:Ni/Co efflux regulator RcnB